MIDRRAAIGAAAGAAAAGVLAGTASGAQTDPPVRGDAGQSGGGKDSRPNVVVIVLDDMRPTDWVALPATRDLLSRSWRFPNFIINCPLCSPSRVSLLTGQFVQNHQVVDNGKDDQDGGLEAFRRERLESRTINNVLHRSGYHTGMVGKFLNGFREGSWRPMGWDRWVASTGLDYENFSLNVDGEVVEFGGGAYKTDVLADYAVQFIAEAPAEKPIFLYFAPTAPHGPATPARRHRGEFKGKMVRRDEAFNEIDLSDKPQALRTTPLLTASQVAALDQEDRDRLRTLLAGDDAIASIFRALDRARRLEDTTIFVLSDNGYLLGQHRLASMKGAPYDDCVRIPMLFWKRGLDRRDDERLASNVDVAPTIAGLAGVKFRRADGIDLLGSDNRDFVPIQTPGNQKVKSGHGIRSAELVYMEYETGERELYDRRSDPLELVNLLPPGSSFSGPGPAGLPTVSYLSLRTQVLSQCVRRRCRT